jgi:hypothetical protein
VRGKTEALAAVEVFSLVREDDLPPPPAGPR